jgi:hypothetical protein
MSDVPTPIIVNASNVPTAVETTIGQILPLLGGAVVSAGWVTGSEWATIAGFIPVAVSLGWRLYRAIGSHNQKKTLAAAAPNSVGVVR